MIEDFEKEMTPEEQEKNQTASNKKDSEAAAKELF